MSLILIWRREAPLGKERTRNQSPILHLWGLGNNSLRVAF